MYNHYDSFYISHHGIKGQRWGIRRFQNEDGSLTLLGKKRASGESSGKTTSKLSKIKSSLTIKGTKKSKPSSSKSKTDTSKQEDTQETLEQKKDRVLKSRSAKQLYDNADLFTTQELQTAYNRLVLEKNIKSLEPKQISKGQQYVNKYVSTMKNVNDVINVTNKFVGNVNAAKKLLGGSAKEKDSSKTKESSESKDKNSSKDGGSKNKKSSEAKEAVNFGKEVKNAVNTAKEETNRDEESSRTNFYDRDDFDRGVDFVINTASALMDSPVAGLLEDPNRRR